jgi:hypothetical protein
MDWHHAAAHLSVVESLIDPILSIGFGTGTPLDIGRIGRYGYKGMYTNYLVGWLYFWGRAPSHGPMCTSNGLDCFFSPPPLDLVSAGLPAWYIGLAECRWTDGGQTAQGSEGHGVKERQQGLADGPAPKDSGKALFGASGC